MEDRALDSRCDRSGSTIATILETSRSLPSTVITAPDFDLIVAFATSRTPLWLAIVNHEYCKESSAKGQVLARGAPFGISKGAVLDSLSEGEAAARAGMG